MKMVIVGATSAIAHEVARNFAKAGNELHLLARDADKLGIVKEDLLGRGLETAHTYVADVCDRDELSKSIDAILSGDSPIDVLFIGHGVLPDNDLVTNDIEAFEQQLSVNFTSVVSIIIAFKKRFVKQRAGTIAVIGSVAGDRGRKSNYAYGTAKAAVATFLGGLRNELSDKGVSVLTIKPGFVDTPMTADLDKGLLFASAEKVAAEIANAIEKKRDLLYTPFFWRFIMGIICLIPEKIFKRLSI